MATDQGMNEPAPKKTNWVLWIGCGLVLVVVLGCGGFFALCGGGVWLGLDQVAKMEQRVTDEPGTPVDATDLSKSPTSYNDKVVSVTGKIIAKPANNEIELAGAPGGDTITCQTGIKKLDLFNSVSVNDTVTVKGICTGKSPVKSTVQVTVCGSVTKK
jgi:hypothetical protein